jgi:carbonic anhydrase
MTVAIQISPSASLFVKDPQVSSTGRSILKHAIPLMQELGFEKYPEFVQKVADLNVELSIEKIKRDSEVLREMCEKGELAIVGAMYDVHTGEVVFMN